MRLFTICSSLHGEIQKNAALEPLVQQVESEVKAAGGTFEFCGEDFSRYRGTRDDVIYVRTGGTEGRFKELFWGAGASAKLSRHTVLLTSGRSNSLAASMEILSFLRRHGLSGEILHGEDVAGRGGRRYVRNIVRPLVGRPELGLRLGVVGKPSDWLIASDVDYDAVRSVLGVELVDVPMDVLLESYRGHKEAPHPNIKPLDIPRYGRPISAKTFQDAVRLYGSLREVVAAGGLDGVALRCFDLLTAIGNTGCLALSLLNAGGNVAACEGDIPAMLSMAVARRVAGTSGFQVNLSQVRGSLGELLFAHCTVPLDIVDDYCYDTHFESGIGVALHGQLPTGPATLFKIAPDLGSYVAEDVLLDSNCYEDGLCRTQVLVKGRSRTHFEALASYLMRRPLANHHILIPGAHAAAIRSLLGKTSE